jgi:hypothetical protein
MNGAVTVSTTSPRCNFLKSITKARIVNDSSLAARRSSAALAGMRFLISTTAARYGGVAAD